jgi:signal transduction histidine kinase
MSGDLPFEALSDAVGELTAAEGIAPRNAAMRDLLAEFARPTLEALVPEPALRQRLQAGDPVTVESAVGTFELRCTGGWLVGVCTARADRGDLAHRRALALSAAAGSIAHDLANLFGAAFGIADTLGDAVRSESDRRLLDGLVEGVRRGSQLTTALERQLRAPKRRRAVADAREVVDSVAAMLGKVVQHKALAIDMQVAPQLAAIRADAVELKQLLLHCAFLAIELGAKRLVVAVAADASVDERSFVKFAVDAEGCVAAAPVVAAVVAALNLARGALASTESVPPPARDAAVAALALLRRGGALHAAAVAGGVSVTIRVPARAS